MVWLTARSAVLGPLEFSPAEITPVTIWDGGELVCMDLPRLRRRDSTGASWVVVAIGVGLGLVLTVETLLRVLGFVTVRETTLVLSSEYLIGVVSSLPFIAGLVWGGLALGRVQNDPVRDSRVLLWVLAGIAVSLTINGALVLVLRDLNPWYVVGWLRWAIAVGGGVGVLVGYIEMRAITNALEADRARVEAEHVDNQREMLDYLNGLLRHEVLNGMNVIEGHSLLLEEKVDDDLAEAHVGPIVRRSQDISEVVSDIRQLVGLIQGERTLEPVDLRRALERENRKLRDSEVDVEVEIDLPDEVFVYGDEMLPRVFGNLLANAAEHNDSDPPRIRIESRQTDEMIEVLVTDNGPGIDEASRETLFERPLGAPTDHGFGLYLVRRLCTHYGGALELAETGPDGTTFSVTLQRATAPAAARSEGPFSAESPT